MKRKVLFILIISAFFAATIGCGFKWVRAEQAGIKTAETDIVAPSSYLEYVKLSSPVDVCVKGDIFAVAERERVVVYQGGAFKKFDLTGYSLSKICIYAEKVLFLSTSRLYVLDIDDGSVTETDVNVSNYFFLTGNTLITNPSNSIYSYRLSVDEENKVVFTIRTTMNLLEHDAAKVTVSPDESIYYYHEGKLIPFDFSSGAGEKITEGLSGVRYSVADDENVYYTSSDGIFRIEINSGSVEKIISAVSEEKLYNLVNPQGICLVDDTLYVCDGTMNSVYKVDLTNKAITDFAVSDRGDAPNRIESAIDFCADENVVYTLETAGIKTYDVNTSSYGYYSLEGFSGAKHVAAADGYILLSDSSNPYLVRAESGRLLPVALNSNVSEYRNVSCLTSYEDDFYFVDNESINSEMFACIYELSLTDLTVKPVGRIRGTGVTISTDIFGNACVATLTDGVYTYHTFNVRNFDATIKQNVLTAADKPISTFIDIQSNLFVLINGGVVTEYSPSGDGYVLKDRFVLDISENLPNGLSIKSALLIGGTDKVFALTDCCLLSASDHSAIAAAIETPARLTVPENYAPEINENPTFITVFAGAKLFIVDLPEIGGDDVYFGYTAFATATEPSSYVVLATTDRYYLAVNKTMSAVIRREDVVTEYVNYTELNKKSYLVEDYGAYIYPVIDDYFKSDSLNKDLLVTAERSFDFDGINYTFITFGDKSAYIPSALLKPDLAYEGEPSSYYTVKIKKGGADVYADSAFTEKVGSLESEANAYAIETDGDAVKIYYNDGVAYIRASDIKSSSYYAVRYIIVISVLLLGLCATLIYIIKVKAFPDKKSGE